MRKTSFEKFGLITPSVMLRHFYKDLTGHTSAAANLTEAEIDGRVKMFFEREEPDVTYDLREVHAGRPSKFSVFWENAKAFLEEDVGTIGGIQT